MVVNGLLYQDGQRFIIIEANSPENKLATLNYDDLDYLHSVGVNTIYATIYGGDDTSICIWENCSTRTTFSVVKLENYKAYLEYWANLGGVTHLLLNERENFNVLNTEQKKKYYDVIISWFDHLTIIYNICEEIPSTNNLDELAAYLQSKTDQIIAVHNWPGERPWDYSNNIDLIALQEFNLKKLDSLIPSLQRSDRAVYASEIGGVAIGNPEGGVDFALEALWDGMPYSSGYGVYSGYVGDCADLDCYLRAHDKEYKALARSGDLLEKNSLPIARELAEMLGIAENFTIGTPNGDVSDLLSQIIRDWNLYQ